MCRPAQGGHPSFPPSAEAAAAAVLCGIDSPPPGAGWASPPREAPPARAGGGGPGRGASAGDLDRREAELARVELQVGRLFPHPRIDEGWSSR